MSRFALSLFASALAAPLLPAVASAQADRIRVPEVNDQAKLFSDKAKAKANEQIEAIQRRYKMDLVIETYEEGAKDNPAAWAKSKAKEKGINGVYVVITRKPAHYEVVVSDSVSRKGLMKTADVNALVKLLGAKLKGSANDPARRDEALTAVTSFVLQKFDENHRSASAAAAPAVKQPPANNPEAGPQQAREEGIPWGRYLLIGLGALLVFWLITGLIRAFSGSGASPGMAGSGGGGGFFSSLLGGLFGAAAGMWLYNSFFGSSTPSAYGGSAGAGGSTGAESNDPGGYTAAGGGDYDEPNQTDDAGGAGGGGDWGDAGSGGGDWGGDAGGGGDW